MKLKSILNLAATLTGANPAVSAGIALVNKFLPDDKKLPETATVDDLNATVEQLPPDVRGSLLEKEIDYKIAESNNWRDIQRHLNATDATGASTRPDIAYLMAWCVVGQVLAVIVCIIAAAFGKTEGLTVLKDCWPMLVASIGTPTILLKAYFGLRTEEKHMRQSIAHGHQPPKKPLGILGKLIN